MNDINLNGLGVALITPFDRRGNVDFDTLSRLVDMQLAEGTDYIVVLGTTAETPTLSPEEQHDIIALVVSKAGGKIPVVLGFGSNNTASLVKRLETEDFTGIDALLSVTPYYNKPSQEGIYRHFKALSAASPRPIVLYNVPSRTGVNIAAETTLRLASECRNICGIKEASGQISQIGRIIRTKPAGFQVISGDDGLTYSLLSLGANGVISVLGNAFPRRFGQMIHLHAEGKTREALAIHEQFADIFGLLSVDGNPSGIKCLMANMGLIENSLRLPLVAATETTDKQMKEELKKL